MPETNGHRDNESRLDRIERAIEHVINEHEMFRAEHQMLLRSQILQQESLEKLQGSVEELKDRVAGIGEKLEHFGEKLDHFITIVDSDHREFHARLTRLEDRQ